MHDERVQRQAEMWPGVDLDEMVPRSVAYLEVYSKLGRWSAEQTGQAFQEAKRRGFADPMPPVWQQAGYQAAARIAHDIYVQIGNRMRAMAAALPEPPKIPAIVNVELPPMPDEDEESTCKHCARLLAPGAACVCGSRR